MLRIFCYPSAICLLVAAPALATPSFNRLGSLSGGTGPSLAFGVSGDGSVIVGASEAPDGIFAFRWTEAGGMVSLGDFSGGSALSRASGVSGDGLTVAGTGTVSFGYDQAFL